MKNNSNFELRKYVVPEIVVGIYASHLAGRYIEHFGAKKPIIVTDKKVSRYPWFNKILDEIASYCNFYVIFDEVSPNPKDSEVMAGAELFLSEKCDIVVAIGGGSPMDCAKGISIVSSNGSHILNYEGVDEIPVPGPPLICIPTTAGSSADVSQFAIICDTQNKVKKAIISKMVVPDLALIDPAPLMDMDPYLTACTAMDALTHAIEAYVSNAQSPLTDIHALEAIGLINNNFEAAIAADRTIDIMYQMMLGSIQAGMAFSNASLGAVHAMAHSMGGLFDLSHGECNSILLEHIININFDSVPERYKMIASRMGICTSGIADSVIKDKLIERISKMRETAGIQAFVKVKCFSTAMEQLVENALNDPCMITNPKSLTKKEVEDIYGKVVRCKK